MKTQTTLDMTTGPIFRKLFIYAYPLMLRSIINTMYSTVDKVVAGKCISTAAMAAIGATTIPINLIVNLVSGLSLGVSVCCGNYFGAKKEKEFRECVHTAVVLGFLGGVTIALTGVLISEPLLIIMKTPESIMRDAKVYMYIRILSYPLALLNTFCCSVMNAQGDTKTPTWVSLMSGAVNVVFNFLFVLGFKMDIAGLAWATMLSHAADTVALIWILFGPKGRYRMRFQELRIHKEHFKKIAAVGLPSGLNTTIATLSQMLLQSSFNSFGEVIVAGKTAASTCSNYVTIMMSGFSSACVCATAQCFGARNFERIKLVVKQSIMGGVVLMTVTAALLTVFVRPLMGEFTNEAAVIEAGIPIVLVNVWGELLLVFGNMYGAALRGMRKSTASMVANLVGICLPRVLWVLLVMPFFPDPMVLYSIFPISWAIDSVLLAVLYRRYYKKISLQPD